MPNGTPGGVGALDDLATQFGLLNALRTGNVVLDMLVCMLLPLIFGSIAGAMNSVMPAVRRSTTAFISRNTVTRKITYVRKFNQYGWTVGRESDDNLLQKGLMIYLSKFAPSQKVQKTARITLTEISKLEQQMQLKDTEDDSGYDSDDQYGPVATLRNVEVSKMPSDNVWIDAGDGVEILRTHSSQSNEGEKSCISTEITTVELRANGRQAEERIDALVQKAFIWYRKSLEAKKDEKRYLYMMLRNPGSNSGTDEPGNLNRLYKRYELSEEKTFSSLFFPQKSALLYILDHFKNKTGKFAIPGFPHKLGILLHGPPGTGKTSLIKAIAHYTKRNIVSIPLSRIKTNQELMDVMFDHNFSTYNASKTSSEDDSTLNISLDFRRTIFVMEDVDAASSVVQRRAPKQDEQIEKKVTTTTTTRTDSRPGGGADGFGVAAEAVAIEDVAVTKEEVTKLVEMVAEGSAEEGAKSMKAAAFKKDSVLIEDDKLDLAGLLNVLDGVVDSPNCIVIMTTNHPEKLNPALIRPGRINKQILMGYLMPADAWSMVLHYFGEADERQKRDFFNSFQANVFTPAQVEQLCAEHDSIDEFLIGLSGLRAKEY